MIYINLIAAGIITMIYVGTILAGGGTTLVHILNPFLIAFNIVWFFIVNRKKFK